MSTRAVEALDEIVQLVREPLMDGRFVYQPEVQRLLMDILRYAEDARVAVARERAR
jgi:hypothetical protein